MSCYSWVCKRFVVDNACFVGFRAAKCCWWTLRDTIVLSRNLAAKCNHSYGLMASTTSDFCCLRDTQSLIYWPLCWKPRSLPSSENRIVGMLTRVDMRRNYSLSAAAKLRHFSAAALWNFLCIKSLFSDSCAGWWALHLGPAETLLCWSECSCRNPSSQRSHTPWPCLLDSCTTLNAAWDCGKSIHACKHAA